MDPMTWWLGRGDPRSKRCAHPNLMDIVRGEFVRIVAQHCTGTHLSQNERLPPEETNRATAASPQACSSNLETPLTQCNCAWTPKRMADVGMCGNALNAPLAPEGACEERAHRLRPTLLALVAPQGGEALLPDLNPSCQGGRAKLKVNKLQDTTLFCDNLLDGLSAWR